MRMFLMIILGLMAVALTAHFVAAARFKTFAAELMAQLSSVAKPQLHDGEIPALITNFVARAGVDRNHLTSTIWLKQVAEMRLNKGGDWQALTAEQVIATGEVGFVWFAAQKMAGVTKFRVIDRYVVGVGQLHVRLLGSIPIVNSMGDDVDIAEIMRYLGELVWAPDAMIGNKALIWEQKTERSVNVSVALKADIVGVTFIFDDVGNIVEVQAKDRPAEVVDGKTALHDWRIKVSEYKDFGGRIIPTKGEVGYVYDDGYEAYWRGEVVEYEVKIQ